MEVTQGDPNLFSEKQAAAHLGVARITLLRAREAGRIRFFRIGTRVLYSDQQLTDFLSRCESKGASAGNMKRQTRRFPASSASCGVRELIRRRKLFFRYVRGKVRGNKTNRATH
jgi:excisionase family DNA binding protein